MIYSAQYQYQLDASVSSMKSGEFLYFLLRSRSALDEDVKDTCIIAKTVSIT